MQDFIGQFFFFYKRVQRVKKYKLLIGRLVLLYFGKSFRKFVLEIGNYYLYLPEP